MSDQQKRPGNSPSGMEGPRVISYNIDEGERPGGMRVRFKIRVITGPRAMAVDAAQAQVLKEVLEWSLQHRQQH